jgi:sterol carrier protein 2
VNNNCSTGSTALHMAKQFVEGGLAECAMALGFEKMEKGSLGIKYTDRTLALDKHFGVMNEQCGFDAAAPAAAQMFGNAGREHMERYGTNKDHFAKIGYKNHKHSVNNPYSQFQDEYTLEQIQGAPTVFDPLTKLQCCPTSDGSGAAIVASEAFVDSHGLRGQAVEILGMNMTTDFKSSFSGSMIQMVGSDMTKAGANKLYESTGFGPENVDVVELHDCFSANELITYEALGLCPEGKAGEFIDSEAQTYGGQVVVNPSGGLISKGHPLGATGLAQCAELTWQLRGTADKRQVADAKIALQHNLGLGGAAVLAMYRMAS